MLTIIYDPINGTAVADGLAMDTAKLIWQGYKERHEAMTYLEAITYLPDTSSEVLINAFRVLVKRGHIPYEELIFKYKDQILLINKYGKLDHWPKCFCDYTEEMMSELIDWKSND